jgi:xylulokinase
MRTFIGVDIGTTGIRAGVYDEGFSLIGTGQGKSIIKKGSNGELYQDTEEIYIETGKAVKDALEKSGVRGKDVTCISFDGQMAGIIGIDEHWNAVTPYDSWLDTRCSQQVEKIKTQAQDLVIERTGNIPSYNHGPKILWWKDNHPHTYSKIKSFIQPNAYVAGRLCGLGGESAFIDWTYLHFSGFAHNKEIRWDDELTGMFDISFEKLPAIVSPLSIVGKTRKEEEKLFGIPGGIPVAAGCGDTASCFLGTGAVKRGIAVDVAGTASVFALTTDRFITDRSGLVYSARSVVQDVWYSMSYINGGGLNLEWFREHFAPQRSFKELDDSIAELTPGSDDLLFIPHLEGRGYPNNPGMRGQWKGFTRNHGISHFYKSILEGIAYEYALYKQRIFSLLGQTISYDVRGVGGGSKSEAWNCIKADILNCRYCTINREDIGILGQALIAAAAVGYIESVEKTVQKIIKIEKSFAPDKRRSTSYVDLIEKYKQILNEYDT